MEDTKYTLKKKLNTIKDLIQAKLVEFTVPSIAVGLARNGEILLEEGFGWADCENKILANKNTIYSLASVSKPITATGIMILKERGMIDLDRPINDYLGDTKVKVWVGNPEEVTVRRVLNHSSGLPLHYQFFCKDEKYPKPPMDETIKRYANVITIPGEKYIYSNIGYGILGYIIYRLSGKSYPDFMREEVFTPLNMKHTTVYLNPRLGKYLAVHYASDGLPIPFYDFDHPGASAVLSSVHDLLKFGMFNLKAHLLEQKTIISDKIIDEMQKPTVKISNGDYSAGPEEQKYFKPYRGCGWQINKDEMGYCTVRHGGDMCGVSAQFVMIPSEKLVVVVLLSKSLYSLSCQIIQEILSIILPEYGNNYALLETRKKKEKVVVETVINEQKEPEIKHSFSPSIKLIGKWMGKVYSYNGEIPFTIWSKESGDVFAQLGGQLKTLLCDVSFENSYLRGKMAGDIGTEDANRRIYYLQLELKLRNQILNGSIIAISDDVWLPERRLGNALSHWVELKKQTIKKFTKFELAR